VTHLRRPTALPAWITITTRRECERVLRTGRRERPAGLYDDLAGSAADGPAVVNGPEDAAIREEQRRALRAGFAQVPPRCRELLGDPRRRSACGCTPPVRAFLGRHG
jgi:DNA-directed RNA polymerase specialized sigma24 family protein